MYWCQDREKDHTGYATSSPWKSKNREKYVESKIYVRIIYVSKKHIIYSVLQTHKRRVAIFCSPVKEGIFSIFQYAGMNIFRKVIKILNVACVCIEYRNKIKESVHEKSSKVMWPSTYPYRWKIRNNIGPKTFNARELRLKCSNGWPFEQQIATTVFKPSQPNLFF